MTGSILVFGAEGQTGRELISLASRRKAAAVGLSRLDVDITQAEAVRAAIEQHRPGLVVNAAGYTAVDRAESEPELARAANVEGPTILAAASARAGAPLVQLSTDYVFDGKKSGAYVENDPIAPLSVYGRTKAEGEAAVREAQPHHVILRTSWIYGVHGKNFLKTVLQLASKQDELTMVADQFGCPTATADIAEAILQLAPRLTADKSVSGTFHFAGAGSTSWHGFATAIVARQRPFTGRNPRVVPITTAEFKTAARRPANSVLDSSRFRLAFGHSARPWQERVAETVDLLLRTAPAAAR
ncbi:MAG TPA: dTDP-4-dehydrorhamnose reductase [Xanthobacteraceae bacterium]|jgi:dTDP-4-dehydrorhamnose reductase